MITKEILTQDIKKVHDKIDKIPTRNEYKIHGEYGVNTVIRRWEKWTLALAGIFPEYEKPKKSIIKTCSYCDKEIQIIPSMIKDKNYCSVSCGNKDKPRRQKLSRPKCATCENTVSTRKGKYCKICYAKKCSFHLKTIGEIRKKRLDANRYNYVRQHARKIIEKHDIKKYCLKCPYNKHVEVCHVKDIGEFPDETTISEINNISNLVYLCRNCHWEFDNGFLKL